MLYIILYIILAVLTHARVGAGTGAMFSTLWVTVGCGHIVTLYYILYIIYYTLYIIYIILAVLMLYYIIYMAAAAKLQYIKRGWAVGKVADTSLSSVISYSEGLLPRFSLQRLNINKLCNHDMFIVKFLCES